jgi:hypothetical protein
MAACEKCGATLAPYAPKCSYCNTVTAAGAEQARAQAAQQIEQARYQAAQQYQAEQYERARASQAVYMAGGEAQRSADQAFGWAIAGLVLCCIPVLPIVGIVLGFRARSVAVSRNIVVPSKAWAAIVMGFVSLAIFGGGIVYSQRLEAEKESHRSALEKKIGKHAGDATPSVDVACALAELYLVDNNFDGAKVSDEGLTCDAAKWSATGDRGELDGVEIRKYASSPQQDANVCFKHGQKWVVDAVVTTSCDQYLREKSGLEAPSAEAVATVTPPPPMPVAPDPLGPQTTPTPKVVAPKPPPRPTVPRGR